ncbi:MAG TPA: hypothetical protein PKC43_13365 [Phycisphaerales bacterium]|nr:hypothetical protein [Phycisphaerales bacterium]HMP38421.1 hypothetical protein [Phycisphaerales bacterium]
MTLDLQGRRALQGAPRRRGAALAGLQAALRIVALAAIVGSAIALLQHPTFRVQLDATRTRAYALGADTQGLLRSLDGDWQVVVVLADASVAPAVRRQIDEVLRRFEETAPRMRCRRIDPTDPAALGAWEALVATIQASSAGEGDSGLAAFRATLDDAAAIHRRFIEFASVAGAAVAAMPRTGDPGIDRELGAIAERFAELAVEGHRIDDQVASFRATSVQQPLADDEAARSVLLASLSHWSDQCLAAATNFEAWSTRAALAEPFRRACRDRAGALEDQAQRLRNAQDRLARQPALDLSQIGRHLASGEAAVVIGPPGAAVVPSWQLLAGSAGNARPDRRFRGEQVLAAAIRSLLRPPPTVVLLHAEEGSPLKAAPDRNDLAAAAESLRAARYDLREWRHEDAAPPVPIGAAEAIWIVVPPLTRRGIDISPRERGLLDRTRRLIDAGQPVLITLGRSLRPLFRQEDPWATILAERGIRAETGSVVFELDRIGPARGVARAWQRIDPGVGAATTARRGAAAAEEHPLHRAIAGLPTTITHPTPLRIDETRPGVRVTVLAVEPGPLRWLERDWRTENRPRATPPAGAALEEPVAVAVAIEDPGEPRRRRRAIVVGSGGWMLSSVLDATEPVGGGRSIAANPGNRELLLGSVAWLAGADEFILPGGGDIARLAGIDRSARVLWSLLAIGAIPLSLLLMGAAVTVARRRG